MIVRPGLEGLNQYSFYALIAVRFMTLLDFVTRNKSCEEPLLMVTFFSRFPFAFTRAVRYSGSDGFSLDRPMLHIWSKQP